MNETYDDLDKMLTVSDIQKHLRMSRKKAYQLVSLDGFPKLTIGRGYLIPRKEYEKWIKENLKHKILL